MASLEETISPVSDSVVGASSDPAQTGEYVGDWTTAISRSRKRAMSNSKRPQPTRKTHEDSEDAEAIFEMDEEADVKSENNQEVPVAKVEARTETHHKRRSADLTAVCPGKASPQTSPLLRPIMSPSFAALASLEDWEDFELNEVDEEELSKDELEDKQVSSQLFIVTPSPKKPPKATAPVKYADRRYVSPHNRKSAVDEISSEINDGLYFYEQDLRNDQKKKKVHKSTSPPFCSIQVVEGDAAGVHIPPLALHETAAPAPAPALSSSQKESRAMAIPHGSNKDSSVNNSSGSHPGKSSMKMYDTKSKNRERRRRTKKTQPKAVGWVLKNSDGSPGSSPPDQASSSSSSSSSGVAVPVVSSSSVGSSGSGVSPRVSELGTSREKEHTHMSYQLMEENGFVQEKYEKYRSRCLSERKRGPSSEMDTLFRFWSHFLRDRFNYRMYNEFKTLALEDAKADYQYGIECLFRFYSYSLENNIRQDLLKDFQNLVLVDYSRGRLYGLEKFWAFLKYRKDKRKFYIKPVLQDILRGFKTVNDFRAKQAAIDATRGGDSSPRKVDQPARGSGAHRLRSRSVGHGMGEPVAVAAVPCKDYPPLSTSVPSAPASLISPKESWAQKVAVN